MSKILVTGATGHLGKGVIENLIKKIPATNIIAMVRDENKAADLKALGVEIRIGDYLNPEALTTALQGVDKLLLISSNALEGRFNEHKNVIDAAKKSLVKHIFYTGVTMQNKETSPLKEFLGDHFRTEDYIKSTGLAYTFLQNNLYAEVIPMFLGEKVLDTGIFFPAGQGKVAFVTRKDLAEAAANVLAGNGHENKSYALSGSHAYSFSEIAKELSVLSGKEVAYISPDNDTFVNALKQFGLPEPIINMSLGFAAAMQHQDFNLPGNTLDQILDHPSTSLSSFLKETYIH